MQFFFSNFLIQLGRGRALDENRKCKLVAISVEFGRDIVEVSTMFEIMQLGGGITAKMVPESRPNCIEAAAS